jgi:hypothetical protein
MTLVKAEAKTNETFIVQASLTIGTSDRKNMFIVQATGLALDFLWGKIIELFTDVCLYNKVDISHAFSD